MFSKNFSAKAEKNTHIKKYLDKQLDKYGEFHYAYAVLNKRNTDDMMIISDLPDYFIDFYLDNKYQNIDPVILNAQRRFLPLIWDEKLVAAARFNFEKIIDNVKPYEKITSGQTFILHDANNNMAVLSLYINKYLSPEINDKATQYKDEIQGLLMNAHEMLLHLYDDNDTTAYDPINALSFREIEILHWSSTGKTYPEIARILNITVSTVKFHMSRIVKKLGVKNSKHAIRVCTELNISPDPAKK